MPGRQAKIITPTMLRRMLGAVAGRQTTKRDRVIILLSVKAGLRACEIARLDWSMVLDARGRVADCLAVSRRHRQEARRSAHPDASQPQARAGRAQAKRQRRGAGGSLDAWRRHAADQHRHWFTALFASLGLEGCSSHSGRRSFITAAARNAHKTGCSLRDVQLLAGHKSIEITQGYIDGDTRGQRRLVALL